jgi:hypothetical protein
MSVAQGLAAPAMGAGTKLKRGVNLPSMARAVGVVVSAGALAAVYQIAHDEVRATLDNWRARSRYRQQRHEALLIYLLGSRLSPPMQERFLRSRDAFTQILRVLAEPTIGPEDRAIMLEALQGLRAIRAE